MISKISVTRPEGSFYQLTIAGEGFGDRPGTVSVWNADHAPIAHVDVKEWIDTAITLEVTDAAMMTDGLMPGSAVVEVVPVPGMMMEFEVPNPDAPMLMAPDEPHTADYDALVMRAEELGVKVDKRWGSDRLSEEIAKAEETE